MEDFVKIASVAEIPHGRMKTVVVNGKRFAVANINGEIFAIDDTCSHEQCSLGTEGYLDGSIIVCGCHGASFDMTTGNVLSLPAPTNIGSYEVKVENGEVYIRM